MRHNRRQLFPYSSTTTTSQNFFDICRLAIDRQICFLCFPFALFSYTFLVFMTLHWLIGYIFYGQPCSQAGRGLEVEAQLRNSLKEASVGLQTFKPSVNNCLSIKLYLTKSLIGANIYRTKYK